MRKIPNSERPRERCRDHGANCLSLRELVALLFGTGPKGLGCMGLSQTILASLSPEDNHETQQESFFRLIAQGRHRSMFHMKEMQGTNGYRLIAAMELSKRYENFQKKKHRPTARKMTISRFEKRLLTRIPEIRRYAASEWLGAIPIHPGGIWGSFFVVAQGDNNSVHCEPRELFSKILLTNAPAFALLHNHPSGSIQPSADDLGLTNRVNYLASSLGLDFLGHWVVSGDHIREVAPNISP